jgi:hypothetical protein
MKTRLKKAYYAHSKRIYGTKREAEEVAYISSVFDGIVICPNNHLGERKSMRSYLAWVSIVDAVFVSEYMNKIGKGVYEECETAIKKGIPVFAVRKGAFGYYHLPVIGVEADPFPIAWVMYGVLKTAEP